MRFDEAVIQSRVSVQLAALIDGPTGSRWPTTRPAIKASLVPPDDADVESWVALQRSMDGTIATGLSSAELWAASYCHRALRHHARMECKVDYLRVAHQQPAPYWLIRALAYAVGLPVLEYLEAERDATDRFIHARERECNRALASRVQPYADCLEASMQTRSTWPSFAVTCKVCLQSARDADVQRYPEQARRP